MIDIHTHILPFVDDGSSDFETSINLIKLEIEQGVTDIFVTPHYFKYRDFLSKCEENKKIFNELVEEVRRQNLKINLFLGNEIFYNSDIFNDLKSNKVMTLNGSKYILIEFPLYEEIEDIPEALNNLTAKGYIPIIAHPERYTYLTNIKHFEIIKRMGGKIQVNSGSITGLEGKKIKRLVCWLIKNGLVDFVASDSHDFRPSTMKKAFDIIKNNYGDEIADRLFNNNDIFE